METTKIIQKPIICYQGSKSRELKIIEQFQPEKFNKLIDVFGGGFNVGLYYNKKYDNVKIIYNDINKTLCDLFSIVTNKKKTIQLLKDYKNFIKSHSFEYYNKVFINKNKEYNDVLRFMYLSSTGFRGNHNSKMPRTSRNNKLIINPATKTFENLLDVNTSNIIIKNLDYKILLNEYKNNEDVFLYLDPPYISKVIDEYNYSFTIDDLIFIKDIMEDEKTKCKIMLHIDFTGWTYNIFKNMIKIQYPYNYSNRIINGIYLKYHCIICNY